MRRRRTSSLGPGGRARAIAAVLLCVAPAGCAQADVVPPAASTPADGPAVSVLPAERSTVWSPGIPGGVPARTKVCATVNASTYGNGTMDAHAGIQAAIDACPDGQVVELSAGEFYIPFPVLVTKSITLRGQGPRLTKLRSNYSNANLVTVGDRFPKFGASTNLAADAVKGARTVTLAGPAGVAAGEIVLVDQATDPSVSQWSSQSPPGHPSRGWFERPDRPLGQLLEVASVNGNTVSFTTPFHIGFKIAFAAQMTRFSTPVVKQAGVEDLYVHGSGGGQGHVWLQGAYVWAKNIESDHQEGEAVRMHFCFRCVLRDSYLHSTSAPRPGGGGYGISISWYSSDSLIENNVVWNMNKVMVARASGGGNVIGYNYMEDGWIDYNPAFAESGLNASHMTTPHFELFEGNQSFNFDGDGTWGNSVYITAFRNHLTGKRRSVPPLALTDEGNRRAIGISGGHWWYSFIGNVLGTADQNPAPFHAFTYEDTYPWDDEPTPMWRLGVTENWGPADPKVLSTVLRDGNFDYFTKQVHWDRTPQPLPNSLYLASKPAFFGSLPWPWVDPTGTTKLYTLPARARFDQEIAQK